MLSVCQHRYEIDSVGDERAARDAAIERRTAELMAEECFPFTPESLGEVLSSGYFYAIANAICKHLQEASEEKDQKARDYHLVMAGTELMSLAQGYWSGKAMEQAEKEIK